MDAILCRRIGRLGPLAVRHPKGLGRVSVGFPPSGRSEITHHSPCASRGRLFFRAVPCYIEHPSNWLLALAPADRGLFVFPGQVAVLLGALRNGGAVSCIIELVFRPHPLSPGRAPNT